MGTSMASFAVGFAATCDAEGVHSTSHMRKEKFWREHLRLQTSHMRNFRNRQEKLRKVAGAYEKMNKSYEIIFIVPYRKVILRMLDDDF